MRAGLDSQYKGTGQGNIVTQGADLLAGNALTLSANAIDLQAAANTTASHSVEKTQSFTLGARPAGLLGDLINSIGDSVKAARATDNDRLQGAYALKAGYDAYKYQKALTDIENKAADKAAAGIPASTAPLTSNSGGTVPAGNSGFASAGIGVQVYVGSSKSKSESRSQETTVTGTNLQAKTISIEATEIDLTMAAAKLQADDITLTAAANTSELRVLNAGIGAGSNYGLQDSNQPKDWIDVTISAIAGFLAAGRGLGPNMTINTSGALIGSTIKGEDPYPAMAGAVIGTVFGYRAGKAIETPLNNKLNPWYRPQWIQGPLTISVWNAPNIVPSISGGVLSSVTQEKVGSATKNHIANSSSNIIKCHAYFFDAIVVLSRGVWLCDSDSSAYCNTSNYEHHRLAIYKALEGLTWDA